MGIHLVLTCFKQCCCEHGNGTSGSVTYCSLGGGGGGGRGGGQGAV
jgi:hypothetical protein